MARQAGGAQRRLIGLRSPGRRVARHGYSVLQGDRPVGVVTSGTLSPTLDAPIALAWVEAACSAVGTQLAVDIRGKAQEAFAVVRLPFYRRAR